MKTQQDRARTPEETLTRPMPLAVPGGAALFSVNPGCPAVLAQELAQGLLDAARHRLRLAADGFELVGDEATALAFTLAAASALQRAARAPQ